MSEEEAKISDEEQELSKKERLEAARKKFEELKKKKKKGKKKSKKESESVEPEEPEDTDQKDTAEPEEVGAEAENKPSTQEVTELVDDDEKSTSAADAVAAMLALTEESTEKEVAEATADETLQKDASESTEKTKTTVEPSKQQEVLTSGAESADSLAIQQLNDTVEQQKNTIKKLRDENTDLKLSRMDLLDKISELELTVEQLKKSGGVQAGPVPAKAIPAKPVFTKNDFASESTQNLAARTTEDFREKLMVWKGWQADMSRWGGVQTQIVKL